VVGAVFLLLWYPPAISYEDKKLHGIFGESWLAWSSRTPALLPRRLVASSSADTSWSFAKSMRQNWEPVIVAYSLFWLWWLWKQLPAAAA
jgi:protein-S-isoprenylcysteine O-methyltransferase Ste14